MSQNARVSAIMAVYNPNHHVVRAIESVLNQTYPVSEFLIINDGGPEEYIKSVLPDDPRIRYILQKNGRVAAARNTGIENATGDYLAFLDQDDFWFPEKLSEQLNLVEFKAVPCMIVSPVQVIDNQDRVLKTTQTKLEIYLKKAESADQLSALLAGNFIYSSVPVIHHSVFKVAGRFQTRFEPHDDWAMYLKISEHGFPIYFYVDKPLSVWRRHAQNESNNWVRMLRTSSQIVRHYQNLPLPASTQDILKLKLCEINLDRVNSLLYRIRPKTFRKMVPHFMYEFFMTNRKLNQYGYPAKKKSLGKSIKRYLISLVMAWFNR